MAAHAVALVHLLAWNLSRAMRIKHSSWFIPYVKSWRNMHSTTKPQHHPALFPWRSSPDFDHEDDGTTAGAPKSKCAQLGCRVVGQAADDDNIRDRRSGDRQWHAAR